MESPPDHTRSASRYLTAEQLTRIERAVRLAESDISGEIVPVFVEKCSQYELVKYRVGAMAAFFATLCVIAYGYGRANSPLVNSLEMAATVALASGLAVLLTYVPAVGRLCAGKELLAQVATRKADSIFLQEEVFGTRQRRGIMIFIALFERCVIIRADKGVGAVVAEQVWDNLEQQLVGAIRQGRLFEGIVASIVECGKLMEAHGFRIAADDTDELPNALRNHD